MLVLSVSSSVILNVTDNRPKTRYILALDDSHNTLQEIVKAISVGLGPGRIENVPKEDALLNREVTVSCRVYYIMCALYRVLLLFE